ncbi:MAG: HAD-superfamily hydrolase, subfamily [Frankiales bacterium]|nr:HAD-superfamily hydrolase, subfamily [Frankiales bacterium]
MTRSPLKAPRLVGTDLDGTIVRSDGTISARTRAAIGAVEDAGATFVMVTGRPTRWMKVVAEQTGHHGIAVCANGALVYDLHAEQVMESFLLSAHVGRQVAAALRDKIPGIAFAVERLDLPFAHEPSYKPRWDSADPLTQGPVEELLSADVVKLLARHEELGSDDLLATAQAVVGDAATLTHSSGDGLLEISAAGISKATGLAMLAAERGVSAEDVVAFGDMPNDLPMLTWAGLGVAVANAHPSVLEAADEVTSSNDDDGVAEVLARWF